MDGDTAGPGAWPARGQGPREALRPGLVWPTRRDPCGLAGPTPGMARGNQFRKSSYGLYVPAGTQQSVEQRIVEAAATVSAGVVTGWAALRWLGGHWFAEESKPVPIVLQMNEGRHRQPSLAQVSQEFLAPWEVIRVDGLRITIPARSVVFEMARAPTLVRALQVFAMAAYNDLLSIDELVRYRERRLPAFKGVGMVRDAIPLLTENAWSPTEVTMAWVWQEERPGVRLLHNCPVFSLDGRHLATPDVIDVLASVVGEYQGVVHLDAERRAADVVRDDVLDRAGLEMAIMVGADLTEPTGFLKRLGGAYERASERKALWTIEPPAWWTDTTTVDARRALGPGERERLLRYRRAA